jgi:predicted glycoside hydrolase/deacetylase ChbG (UPF0249 family)
MFSKQLFKTLVLYINLSIISNAQSNIAVQLGYPEDSKLLIIHADDLGVSHSENIASIEALENGSVNSASVMMPTPWVMEVADYAKKNPDTHDFGLHLVLSSEWKHYKWGPVSSRDKVPSLINEHGYFHEACIPDLNLIEVETELKAQIDRAYAMGLEPTHLDNHMRCLVQSQELLEIYLKMGQLYNLPVFISFEITEKLKKKYDVQVTVDAAYTLTPEEYVKGTNQYYINIIKNLKPGLSTLIIHTAYDNEEMKGMNIDHPDWGNEWRQKDFEFFTSELCRKTLEEENIKLVTWRQIKEVFYPKN